ncbi:uncharacterized protein LOC105231785 [Bactrocera dorsalis]|uniref:Regulatory protein zeste n=1 Tax=Bactrocera dorsalis TaxID=27457 RepID=A0A8N4L9M5_BACDO|nr:uncharacterized protein LOC105231785 [Bactrocera dorsalis]
MSKTTTPQQYVKLAEIMEKKPDIANGFHKGPKEDLQAFWQEVASNLNALGPPSKDSLAWRKVWIDWKCYIKRKLTSNKKEMLSTGGGQCRLQRISPLEEKIVRLTGLEISTSGIQNTFDYGDSTQDAARTSEMDISAHADDVPSTSRAAYRERRPEKESAASLLREQQDLQKEFYAETKLHYESIDGKMKETVTYLRRMNRSLEVLADTAVQQLQEQQRHNRVKEQLLKEKLDIKLQMLKLDPNYKY